MNDLLRERAMLDEPRFLVARAGMCASPIVPLRLVT
jgi:hypothetical protein